MKKVLMAFAFVVSAFSFELPSAHAAFYPIRRADGGCDVYQIVGNTRVWVSGSATIQQCYGVANSYNKRDLQ